MAGNVVTLDSGILKLSEIKLRELTTDPSSVTGEAWVLRTHVTGSPIGLLLALTYAAPKYNLSFKAIDGSIVRTELI